MQITQNETNRNSRELELKENNLLIQLVVIYFSIHYYEFQIRIRLITASNARRSGILKGL